MPSRGATPSARRNARSALELAAGDTDFEAWLKKHRRAALPALDLKAKEIAALRRLAT